MNTQGDSSIVFKNTQGDSSIDESPCVFLGLFCIGLFCRIVLQKRQYSAKETRKFSLVNFH